MSVTTENWSALENLQHHSSATRTISDSDVERAILVDLENGRDVNEVLLTKFVRHMGAGDKTLQHIIRSLQGKMHTYIDTNPAHFLNYTKAQLVLASELKRRVGRLEPALRP